MPLRDPFRPPVSKRASWQAFHALWPATIVRHMESDLPVNYVAEPLAQLGDFFEIDVASFCNDSNWTDGEAPHAAGNGSPGEAKREAPAPTLTIDAEFPEQYAYEILVFDLDLERERELVAAVEFVSPGNKDRPDSRQLFVAKCAGLLQKGVCVSIVDVVTTRRFNLYQELLALLDRSDPSFSVNAAPIYAVTCRRRKNAGQPKTDLWAYPLQIGEALPKLPIWLNEEFSLSIDLEASYEETCRILRIG